MNFALSFSLFFVVIVFYIVVVQVFTVLFRITGMTQEKARFQVISLLTNSGYTTKESELVVDVVSRRRLARFIMLFGYTFSITVVSVFVNMMLQLPSSEKDEVWPALIIVSTLFVVFLMVWRIPIVKTAMDSIVERAGRSWIYGDHVNSVLVQDEYPRGVVAAVTLNEMPADIAGKDLRELRLPERFGIHVVLLNRNGVLEIDTDGNTVLQKGDIATVFGPLKAIREVFQKAPHPKSTLEKAPRPVTEEQFIHEQDVANAQRAAEKAHREEETRARAAADKSSDQVHASDAAGSKAEPATDMDANSSLKGQTESGVQDSSERQDAPPGSR